MILRIFSPSLGSYALMCLTWCRESLSMAASMACTQLSVTEWPERCWQSLKFATWQLSFGHLDAPLDPHGLCGEVGVSSSSIPVTGHRLRVERHHDAEVLRHPLRNTFVFSFLFPRKTNLEEVSADPEVVTHVDSLCGTNLVLPLGGHHLGVGSRDPGRVGWDWEWCMFVKFCKLSWALPIFPTIIQPIICDMRATWRNCGKLKPVVTIVLSIWFLFQGLYVSWSKT